MFKCRIPATPYPPPPYSATLHPTPRYFPFLPRGVVGKFKTGLNKSLSQTYCELSLQYKQSFSMDPMVIESPVGDNSEKREKRRNQRERKKQTKNAAQIEVQTQTNEEADGNLGRILLRKDLTTQTISGNPKKDLGSEESHLKGHMKKERKKNMKKEAYVDKGKEKIDDGPTNNLVEINVTGNIKRKQMKAAAIEYESPNKCQTGSTENGVEGYGTHKRKRKRKRKRNKIMKEEANVVSTIVFSSDVKNVGCLCPLNARITSTRRRKLLVLDLNGVLADIIRPPIPEEIRRRTQSMFGQAIFKRPFYYDFLKFCFENFDVGIWSSRSRKRVPKMVNYLLGDLKRKLVFCWDMSHVTPTGFQTIENRKKPLVLKELRKIWEFSNPRLGWEKGYYNESNTLLLDDSPYKALLNPVNTAIFPYSYCSQHEHDNSLGPGGELRIYLEGLLASENVQDYVERNPFGQSAITTQHPSWGFYQQVLNCVSGQSNKQK